MTTPTSHTRPRLDWIDVMRALPMFMVVLIHASGGLQNWYIYNNFVGPIMLPLFFAITGYVFQGHSKKIGDFLWGLIRSLVVPWLFFLVIHTNAFLIPFDNRSWMYFLEAILEADILWFLPACILGQIILFFILKICKKPLICCAAMILVCLAGFLMAAFNVGNILMFNRALIAQAFLLIGYIFKQHQHVFMRIPLWGIAIALLTYIGLGCFISIRFPEDTLDVHLNQYPHAALWFIMIFIGCFMLFALFSHIHKAPKWITFLGQNTLLCYAMHPYSFWIFSKFMHVLGISVTQTWGWAILNSFWAMASCAMLSLAANWVVPELVGKRRKNDIIAFTKRLFKKEKP